MNELFRRVRRIRLTCLWEKRLRGPGYQLKETESGTSEEWPERVLESLYWGGGDMLTVSDGGVRNSWSGVDQFEVYVSAKLCRSHFE